MKEMAVQVVSDVVWVAEMMDLRVSRNVPYVELYENVRVLVMYPDSPRESIVCVTPGACLSYAKHKVGDVSRADSQLQPSSARCRNRNF